MLGSVVTQVWPAFVLVAALLVVGELCEAQGVFRWAAHGLEALPGGGRTLFAAAMALVAAVTAVLNLDTAVVFLTPVLVGAAQLRGTSVEAFLYGTVLMANASSLFLPGANLTNLIVLGHERISGGAFAGRLLPVAITAAVVTAAALLWRYRRALGAGERTAGEPGVRPGTLALAAATAAGALTVVLARPALPVLAVAVVAAAVAMARGIVAPRAIAEAVSPFVLAGLFALSVALGVAGQALHASELIAGASGPATTGIAALGAVVVNNLPASVLLSGQPSAHPEALLLGLNVGPNLVIAGSLAGYLWFRAARRAGATPSVLAFTRVGAPIALLAMTAATGVQALVRSGP